MVTQWRRSTRPFGVTETHGMLALAGIRNQSSSDGLNWRSLYMSSQTEQPFRGSFVAKDPLVVFHRQPIVGYMDLHRSDPVYAPSGSVRFVPPDIPFEAELCETADTVHLYIRREIWNEVAMEMTDQDPAKVPFEARLLASEPMLATLCMAGLTAMNAQDTDPAFTDHLSRCIASHIMSAHLGVTPKWRTSETGHIISAEVARAIDYIESNADKSIGLQDIASAAYRSPSHLARIFSAEVGMPPHRYLIGVRVKRAQQMLARTSNPIAEIALDCGFTHQEHLTRIFRRYYNTTPAAFRKSVRGVA